MAKLHSAAPNQVTHFRHTAAPAPGNAVSPVPTRVDSLLDEVQVLLDAGRQRDAFDRLKFAGSDPALKNAFGVCALRTAQPEVAVSVFRGLCLNADSVLLRSDVPLVWRTNFATALLIAGNVLGGSSVLDEIDTDDDPRVRRLRQAIRNWEGQLTLGQWFNWRLGVQPQRPLVLDFAPGDLR